MAAPPLDAGAVHVSAGLLTTRSTTVEEARVRGVQVVEPSLMRLVRGAELNALSTGVGKGGTTKVLPPCPREVAEEVAARLLGTVVTVPIGGPPPAQFA